MYLIKLCVFIIDLYGPLVVNVLGDWQCFIFRFNYCYLISAAHAYNNCRNICVLYLKSGEVLYKIWLHELSWSWRYANFPWYSLVCLERISSVIFKSINANFVDFIFWNNSASHSGDYFLSRGIGQSIAISTHLGTIVEGDIPPLVRQVWLWQFEPVQQRNPHLIWRCWLERGHNFLIKMV